MSVWFNNSNRRAVEVGTDTEQLELGPDTDFWKTSNDFTIYKKGAWCIQVEGWKEDLNEASVEHSEKMLKKAFTNVLKMGFKEGHGTCKAEGFPV
jgi:hypothetical protein